MKTYILALMTWQGSLFSPRSPLPLPTWASGRGAGGVPKGASTWMPDSRLPLVSISTNQPLSHTLPTSPTVVIEAGSWGWAGGAQDRHQHYTSQEADGFSFPPQASPLSLEGTGLLTFMGLILQVCPSATAGCSLHTGGLGGPVRGEGWVCQSPLWIQVTTFRVK